MTTKSVRTSGFERSTRPFLTLKKWRLDDGQKAEKNTSTSAPAAGTKTGAFPPVISPSVLPPLQPVPTSPELAIEFVPPSCWFSHVRDHVSTEQWSCGDKQTYCRAHYVYELCGVWS
jgi:hypothetical protein